MNVLLLFQEFQLDSTSVGTEPTVTSQSFLDIVLNSGTFGIIIVALQLILSAIGVYIFIERYLTIRRAAQVDDHFMNNIRMNVQTGNIQGAKALCQTTDSPVARMMEKGLQRIGKPLRDIDAAIENVGNLEVFKLEKNLSTLASIAGATPMLGFLGTVTGMILSFQTMAVQESVTPAALATGIYQALITTAFGLIVGIAAYIGYNVLVSNVEKVVFKMERSTTEFMDLLQEPGA
ncbi:MAG: MotA/TolQ/ExbB proton channel family protein [Saprospiraceae bacterium]|nr:MotA/TolQ/ExbB proton channel family protein [Saprospiraceae bacterium]